MKKTKLTVQLLALLLWMQACQSNNDAVLLKFNLQKGKAYAYSMNMNGETQNQKKQPT